jgi:hypothetical protein
MKKHLMTTTALVAAGVLTFAGSAMADRPKLSLNGAVDQIFGVGQDDADFAAANGARVGFDQHSDTEIHFRGSVKLDNGISITTRTELEGNSQILASGGGGANGPAANGNFDDIDENWLRISGGFGQIVLGSQDLAAQRMTTGYLGAWSTGVGLNHAFDTGDWVTAPGAGNGHRASTVARVDISSDAEGVTYFTPRFSGFQLGASYMPAAREDVNNQRELKTVDTDGVSVGANFVKNMGGIGVGVAVGYATSNEGTANLDDAQQWGIGVRLDFGGIRVGMSHVDVEDQGTADNTAANGQKTFEAGVRYTFGPNAVSAQYLSAETDSRAAARDNDEVETMWLSYRRTLGPGVSWTLSAIFADYEDGAAVPAAAAENDGNALVTAIRVRF